ncbi:MAG: hypothetical protein AAGI08_03730, partial [Bacteroidota bacterium]
DGSVVEGASLSELVGASDTDLATIINGNVTTALSAVEAIPVPFDQSIIHNQEVVISSVDALQELGDSFVQGAQAIGLAINTELPD